MKSIIGVIFLVFVIVFCLQQIEKDRANFYNSINQNMNENTSNNEKINYVTVKISGCVEKPGSYIISSGSFLDDVITQAKGITVDADLDCFNYYLIIEEDTSIYIPKSSKNEKLSINEASINDFTNLPGIGSTIATRIVEYREEIGEYTYLEEIMKVSGVGTSIFNNIKDKIKL